MRTPGPTRRAIAAAMFVLTLAGAARCSDPLEPIVIDSGSLTVRNLTPHGWRHVEIFVNDYYAGTADSVPAGGFTHAPLANFITTYGQHFNTASTEVRSVVVKAIDDTGHPVRIPWGQPGLR